MTQQFNNGIPFRGDIRIIARDAITNEIIRNIEIRNTITYVGLTTIVRLWSQRTIVDPTDLAISALNVGTGTTPPVRGDTALVSEVYSIPLSDSNKVETTVPPTFEIKILATLEKGTSISPFNNQTISEAGLFTADGQLIARQIHPGLPKTTAIVIDYEWRISFTA
jgi:hypothetical protein